MKNLINNKTKKYLKRNSICSKCKIEMEFIRIPLNELPFELLDLILALKCSYEYVRCKKCGEIGTHLF